MELAGYDYLSEDAVSGTRYRYNGKELNPDLGLYDYGARWYDPAIGRFLAVDPMAGSMPSWSPYNYVFGNPINLTDPTGMFPANASPTMNGGRTQNPYGLNSATNTTQEDKDESKREASSKASSGTTPLSVFVHNDASRSDLSAAQFIAALNATSDILDRNNITDNVFYYCIDKEGVEELPSYFEHGDHSLFLALTNGQFGPIGVSDINPYSGKVGTRYITDGEISFRSGIDVDATLGRPRGNTDLTKREVYGLGWVMAHELGHQLDAFSRMAINGKVRGGGRDSRGHYRGTNLLMDGLGFRNHMGPGGQHELLPEDVRSRIIKYRQQ